MTLAVHNVKTHFYSKQYSRYNLCVTSSSIFNIKHFKETDFLNYEVNVIIITDVLETVVAYKNTKHLWDHFVFNFKVILHL